MDNLEVVASLFQEFREVQVSIETLIDKLLSDDFSKEASNQFKKSIEEHLNGPKSNFAISLLFDRSLEVAKVIKANVTEHLYDFRKLIKVIISLDNEKVTSYFATNILKKGNVDQLFIFLEENLTAKRDISFVEDTFIQLIPFHRFNYLTIKRFLNIVSKNNIWLIHKMLSHELDAAVVSLIYDVHAQEPEALEEVAEAIATFDKYKNEIQCARLMVFILQHNNYYVENMVNKSKIFPVILESVIIAEQRTLSIKNYSEYLFNKDSNKFYAFENRLLNFNTISPNTLLEYAKGVSFSSKRKVLKRLISAHSEKELVDFIKNFPEYENLLPML